MAKNTNYLNFTESIDEIKNDIKAIINSLNKIEQAVTLKSESESYNTNDVSVNEVLIDKDDSQNDSNFNTIELLKSVKNSQPLSKIFLDESSENNPEKEMTVLIVKASQWENILQAWDKLFNKCKEKNCKAEDWEIKVIADCLKLHNYRWTGKKSTLVVAQIGESYDYKKHQDVNHQDAGKYIKELWLPGLQNAGGELQKKPLVLTTLNYHIPD